MNPLGQLTALPRPPSWINGDLLHGPGGGVDPPWKIMAKPMALYSAVNNNAVSV